MTSNGSYRRPTMRTIDYEVGLHERLKDPEYAREYLLAALEDGPEVFLLAVRDVIGQ